MPSQLLQGRSEGTEDCCAALAVLTSPARPTPRRRGAWKRWLLLLLVLGVAQRLVRYFLRFPVWGDEAFVCLNLMDRDYLGLTRPLRFDQVAPLLFLWGEETVYRLLGGSELALRLLPVLAGVGSLFLFARLAFAVLRSSAALLAAGILAVSYYPVRHSCEIKPYAFDLFQSLVLLTPAVLWLRRPDHRRHLVFLVAAVPLVLASSYPAAFIAGAVSFALFPAVCRRRDGRTWLLYMLFNLLAIATFIGLFLGVGQGQHDSMTTGCRGYWDAWFPPADLREVPHWLLAVHTGNMLAYPAGGRDGASTITLLLCLAGAVYLARRRPDLLGLLLMPFVLTFLAALLGQYPYGGSARVTQHLAPSICLLAGAGAAALLRMGSSGSARRRGTVLAVCLLAALGVAGLFRDVRKPYKTEGDERARQVVRTVLERAGSDPVVVLDAPSRLYPSLEWYLRHEGHDVMWARSREEVPLGDGGDAFWCLRFRTNDGRLDELPPCWDGPHGLFALKTRERFLLDMGPEPDATHSCEVSRWVRVATRDGGRRKQTGP